MEKLLLIEILTKTERELYVGSHIDGIKVFERLLVILYFMAKL